MPWRGQGVPGGLPARGWAEAMSRPRERKRDFTADLAAALRPNAAVNVLQEAKASLREPSRPFTPADTGRRLFVQQEYSDRPQSSYGVNNRALFGPDPTSDALASRFESLASVTPADALLLSARVPSRGLDMTGSDPVGASLARGQTPSSPASSRGLPPRPRSSLRGELTSQGGLSGRLDPSVSLRAPSPSGAMGAVSSGATAPLSARGRAESARAGSWGQAQDLAHEEQYVVPGRDRERPRTGSRGSLGHRLSATLAVAEDAEVVTVDTDPWEPGLARRMEGLGVTAWSGTVPRGAEDEAGAAWAEEVGGHLREVLREVPAGAAGAEELAKTMGALRAVAACVERASPLPEWPRWLALPCAVVAAPPGAGSGEGRGPEPGTVAWALEEAMVSLTDLRHPGAVARACAVLLRVSSSPERCLQACRVLFRLSKDASADAHFRGEGALPPLLGLVDARGAAVGGRGPDAGTWAEALIYAVGALKNVSQDVGCQRALHAAGALGVAARALVVVGGRAGVRGGAEGPEGQRGAQLAVQVVGMLRNLSVVVAHARDFARSGAVAGLMTALESLPGHHELAANAARVLSKLSMVAACQAELAGSVASLDLLLSTAERFRDDRSLAVRLVFALANVTTTSDAARDVMAGVPGAAARVAALAGHFADAQGGAEVLLRLMRLIANMAIHRDMGPQLAADPTVTRAVVHVLADKSRPVIDELSLNTVCALTNLTFYMGPDNRLLHLPPSEILPLVTPLLLSSNDEAVVEATRALGNLSRRPEARRWMLEARIAEALVLLLNHASRAVLRAVCGVVTNLAADPALRPALAGFAAPSLVVDVLDRALTPETATAQAPVAGSEDGAAPEVPAPDLPLAVVAMKALVNLLAHAGEDEAALTRVEMETAEEQAAVVRELALRESTAGAAQDTVLLCDRLCDLLAGAPVREEDDGAGGAGSESEDADEGGIEPWTSPEGSPGAAPAGRYYGDLEPLPAEGRT